MYVRGHASDYDAWVKLGNEGWSFADLLPYFKKAEHFDEPAKYSLNPNIPLETTHDADFHGTDGPIHTSFSTWRLPAEKELVEAAAKAHEKMGVPLNPWGGDHLGTFHSLSTIDRSTPGRVGTRSYSATGYLLPNAQRPNLHVLTEALATKLIVSDDGTVSGVEFVTADKERHSVHVKKEVILSAGVIKSPQILELSGIGNPSILAAAGVPCVVENPWIGENLQDHVATVTGYELADGEISLDIFQDPAKVQEAVGQYMTSATGPLSSTPSTMAYFSYANLAGEEEIAETQRKILAPYSTGSPQTDLAAKRAQIIAEGLADPATTSIQIVLLPASLNVENLESNAAFLSPPESQLGKIGFSMVAAVSRPLSLGTCHITTASPFDDPAIDPAYLNHPADVAVLGKGLELIEKIVETSPFKEKIKRRYTPVAGDALVSELGREEYARKYSGTEYHPLGTVAMGQATDARLRVKGTKGLRVVDASVFPMHISANLVATVYAVAEKASDLIKADWGFSGF